MRFGTSQRGIEMKKLKVVLIVLQFMLAPFYEACVMKVVVQGNELGDMMTEQSDHIHLSTADTQVSAASSHLRPRPSTKAKKAKLRPSPTAKKSSKKRHKRRYKRRYKRSVSKRPPVKRNRVQSKWKRPRKRKSSSSARSAARRQKRTKRNLSEKKKSR